MSRFVYYYYYYYYYYYFLSGSGKFELIFYISRSRERRIFSELRITSQNHSTNVYFYLKAFSLPLIYF